MAVKIISGIPGSGKTLECVRLAKKHYKSENNKVLKIIRKIKFYLTNFKIFLLNIIRFIFNKRKIPYKEDIFKKYIYDDFGKINNVYSNFPILLNKRKGSYSNLISLWDLDNRYSFLPNSLIIIDEIQLYLDSDEAMDRRSKELFRPIARFNQAHRHYGIKDIIYVSQHPSRVMKKIRNLTNEFHKINYFTRVPKLILLILFILVIYIQSPVVKLVSFILFILFRNKGIYSSTIYYEVESYGMSTKIDKDFATYDFKKRFRIYNIKKLYKSYDTCYLKAYNEGKPLMYGNYYTSKTIDLSDLEIVFPLDKYID